MERDRIFKGATRPAMMLGVPIVPCILVMGVFIVFAVWSLLFFGLVFALSVLVVLVFVMLCLRYITASDDHRLNQYLLWLRSRPLRRAHTHWGAHGVSPTDFKKRRSL